jgi:hypothetical protein
VTRLDATLTNRPLTRLLALLTCLSLASGCSRSPAEPTPTPAPTPTTPVPTVVIAAPAPAGPPPGTTSFGWPMMSVVNATRTGTSNNLVYRFDISTRDDFSTVAFSALIPEAAGQTGFTPPSTQQAPAEGNLYWRVIAMDQANAIQSGASPTQHFVYYTRTDQNRIAQQLGVALWPGVRPSGTYRRAVLGPGWQVQTVTSFQGVVFQSPPLEILQLFDLLDLGFEHNAAIGWLKRNGYATTAAWYPEVATFGFPYQYLSLVRGEWELVRR